MPKKSLILIIVLIILIGAYFLLFPPKGVNHHQNTEPLFDLNNNVEVKIRDMSDVPTEYYSGNSRYSHGKCKTDADCYNIGCSLEMCSSNKDLMTTCEINGKSPDKSVYACGCIKDRCGWYKK